jgi:hypothetical protein
MAPKASDLRRHRDHPKHPEGADHGPVRLDWIIVDLQHGPSDLTSAHAMITATAGTPCVPLARIAANEPHLAKAPMDIGALGINFLDDFKPPRCRKGGAQLALSAARRPAVGAVPCPVPLRRLDGRLYGGR